jgi:hypothetical protein
MNTILGIRLKKTIKKNDEKKYFMVRIRRQKMYLNKESACWYMQDKKHRLSCDRLKRVQQKKNTE